MEVLEPTSNLFVMLVELFVSFVCRTVSMHVLRTDHAGGGLHLRCAPQKGCEMRGNQKKGQCFDLAEGNFYKMKL